MTISAFGLTLSIIFLISLSREGQNLVYTGTRILTAKGKVSQSTAGILLVIGGV